MLIAVPFFKSTQQFPPTGSKFLTNKSEDDPVKFESISVALNSTFHRETADSLTNKPEDTFRLNLVPSQGYVITISGNLFHMLYIKMIQ